MNYFVTAIGTDSGKSLVSSILAEALKADYWKPVQAGAPLDTETVKSLVSNKITKFHPESHRLKLPASPHAAASTSIYTLSSMTLFFPKPITIWLLKVQVEYWCH